MRSGGRVVEGARLESEYTPKAYRGFESLPLRQAPVPPGSQQSTGLDNIGRNQRIFPPARSTLFVTLRRSCGLVFWSPNLVFPLPFYLPPILTLLPRPPPHIL